MREGGVVFFGGSMDETTKAFPLRGRWPEGPDEVATNEKLS